MLLYEQNEMRAVAATATAVATSQPQNNTTKCCESRTATAVATDAATAVATATKRYAHYIEEMSGAQFHALKLRKYTYFWNVLCFFLIRIFGSFPGLSKPEQKHQQHRLGLDNDGDKDDFVCRST